MEKKKTIKDLADELGTNKTKIFRIIKNRNIQTKQERNRIILGETEITLIKQALLEENHNANSEQKQINDTIFVLKNELKIAHEHNENLQKLLDQQQQLQQQLQQMLEEKILLLETVQETKWWQFWK